MAPAVISVDFHFTLIGQPPAPSDQAASVFSQLMSRFARQRAAAALLTLAFEPLALLISDY